MSISSCADADLAQLQELTDRLHKAQAHVLLALKELTVANPTIAQQYMSCGQTLENFKNINSQTLYTILAQKKSVPLLQLELPTSKVKVLSTIDGLVDDLAPLCAEALAVN